MPRAGRRLNSMRAFGSVADRGPALRRARTRTLGGARATRMRPVAAPSRAPARRAVLGFLLRCLAYWGIALALVSRFKGVEAAGIDLTVGTLQATLGLLGLP